MKIKKIATLLLFMIIALVVAGCSNNQSSTTQAQKPEKVQQKFLFFTEDYVNYDGVSIGDLYIMAKDSEPEKISSGVQNGSFQYVNNLDKVFFINEDDALYEYTSGQDKVKLAEGVYSFNGNYEKGIVTYYNDARDLYILINDEKEKVASNVSQYELIGDDLYYLDYKGNYILYNIAERHETEIASDVYYFEILNNKGDVVYLNDDSLLYYKQVGKESVRISNDESSFVGVLDNKVIYLSGDDVSTLYTTVLSEKPVTEKIASEVMRVDYDKDNFYYINTDNNLFVKNAKAEKATKIASDIISMSLNGNLYFMDEEDNLYKLKGESKEKVASSVTRFTPSDDAVYTNDKNELFVGSTKISSDIDEYAYYFNNVAYATKDDKLYLMDNMGEAQVISEDLKKYTNAYYQNQLIYSNELSLDDIAGVWKLESEYETIYFELNKDGVMKALFSEETTKLEAGFSDHDSIEVSADGEYYTIVKNNDQSITIINGYDEYNYTKSSKAEAEEYKVNLQLQADTEDIGYLISNYLREFVYAVNYGYTSDLDDYIDVNSALYDQQVNFVDDVYDTIYEELLDHNIIDTKKINDNQYEVIVNEKFSIYNYSEGTEKEVSYTNTYTVKRMADEFFITDLKVSIN